ncbi:MAG: hypothetical protein EPO68_13610 [Planctomycetota bacterium]|nr:MAG: hypothetical protein EPO68_13610 [Planctomycetota bacterium]
MGQFPDSPASAPLPEPDPSLASLASRAARGARPEPHPREAVAAALRNPLRMLELAIAAPERIGANIEQRAGLAGIALAFLLCGVAFAVPYGCVLELRAFWKPLALFAGSTALCLPALYVFALYLGQRVTLPQILVLALAIPAASAAFTFGFAPILWFLRVTMHGGGTEIPWQSVSSVLLGVALVAGIVQLWRSLFASRLLSGTLLLPLVMLVWHAVFLHVFVRMFRVLEL